MPRNIDTPPKKGAKTEKEEWKHQAVSGTVNAPSSDGAESYKVTAIGAPFMRDGVEVIRLEPEHPGEEVTVPLKWFTPDKEIKVSPEDVGSRPEGETDLPVPTSPKKPEPPENLPTSAGPITIDHRGWTGDSAEDPAQALAKVRSDLGVAAKGIATGAGSLKDQVLERLSRRQEQAEVDPQIADTPKEQRRILGGLIDRVRKLQGGSTEKGYQAMVLSGSEGLEPLTPEELNAKKEKSVDADALRKSLQEEKLAKNLRLNTKREGLKAAQDARTDVYKEYLRKERELKKFRLGKSREQKDADAMALRDEFDKLKDADRVLTEAQVAYGSSLDASVKSRLQQRQERYGTGLKEGETYEDRAEQIMRRYNRVVRLREVIKPSVEAENEARLEVAGEKTKNVFKNWMNSYRRVNERMEEGLTGFFSKHGADEAEAIRRAQITARAIRVVGFAGAGALVGTAGAFISGGAAALTAGAVLGKIGIGLGSVAGGAKLGYMYGERFDRTKGAARKETYNESLSQGMDSAEAIAAQKKAFAEGSDKALIQARATRENMVASLSGLGLSLTSLATNPNTYEVIRDAYTSIKQAIAQVDVSEVPEMLSKIRIPIPGAPEAPETVDVSETTPPAAEDAVTTVGPTPAEAPEAPAVSEAPAPAEVSAQAAPTAEAAPAAPEAAVQAEQPAAADAQLPQQEAPSAPTEVPAQAGAAEAQAPAAGAEAPATTAEGTPGRSLAIEGRINNADRLIGHFGVQLQGQYENLDAAPRSVQTLVNLLTVEGSDTLLSGEDKATLMLGLQGPNGLSAVVHPGDTIRLTDAGEIVFERPGHPELTQTLINANGEVMNATERVSGATGFDMRGPGGTEAADTAPQQPPVTEPQAPQAPEAPSAPEATATQPDTSPLGSIETAPPPAPEAGMDGGPIVPPTDTAPAVDAPPAPGESPRIMSPAEFDQIYGNPNATNPGVEAPVGEAVDAIAAEVTPNQYNVMVDPRQPAVYQWRVPGGASNYFIAHGPDAQATAERYVAANPRVQVLFEQIRTVAGETIREMMIASRDADGVPQPITQAIGADGRPWPLPDTNDFTQRVTP